MEKEKEKMTTYLACAIAEGFCEGEGATEEQFQEIMEYDKKHTELYEMIKGVLEKARGSRKKKKTKRKPINT